MIDKDTFTVIDTFHGSKGLVYVGDDILVFRRDNKTTHFPLMIDLPGGGREVGESPFDTFKRETFEEFGLIIEKEDVIYSKRYMSIMNKDMYAFFIVVKNENLKKEDIIFGDEGLEYMLMKGEEFVALHDAVSRQQERVKEFLEYR